MSKLAIKSESDFKQYISHDHYYGYHCHVTVFELDRIEISLVLYDEDSEATIKCYGIVNRTIAEVIKVRGFIKTATNTDVVKGSSDMDGTMKRIIEKSVVATGYNVEYFS
jgi:uncharacterized phage-like protein YoqJ